MRTLLLLAFLAGPAARAAGVKDPLPAFALSDLQGGKKTSGDFKGKVLLVNFWASWCPPCQSELPELERLAAGYKTQDYSLIAINVDEKTAQAEASLARLKLADNHMQILLDPGSTAYAAFHPRKMPSSFIVDAQGRIRFLHSGFRAKDPESWRREIDLLLKERGRAAPAAVK